MRVGREFEPMMANMYEHDYLEGHTLERPTKDNNSLLFKHPRWNFFLAHLDGCVRELKRVLEIKVCMTPGTDKKWCETNIPMHYYCQGQWELMVTGFDQVDFFVCLPSYGPNDVLRRYTFNRDHELILRLKAAGKDFWENHVQKKIPPDPRTQEEVKALFPNPTEEMVEATPADIEEVAQLQNLNGELKKLNKQKKITIDRLSSKIKDSKGIKYQQEDGNWRKLATFDANKRGSRTFRAFG